VRGAARAAAACAVAAMLLGPAVAGAEPVRMRYPEGPTHGFLVLSDVATDKPIARGELIQWIERGAIVSRLVFYFDDGSLYDETVRFSQRPVFKVLSYHLIQKGPSFSEPCDNEFDSSGRYRARLRSSPDGEEQTDSGVTEIPADVSNGMMSTLLKNLPRGASATVHIMTFRPKPMVLDLELTPEGTDRYWVGKTAQLATRFLVKPKVGGVKGVFATIAGKQPPEVRMWIGQGRAPSLVRFEGPIYYEGPPWRVELSAPRWKE